MHLQPRLPACCGSPSPISLLPASLRRPASIRATRSPRHMYIHGHWTSSPPPPHPPLPVPARPALLRPSAMSLPAADVLRTLYIRSTQLRSTQYMYLCSLRLSRQGKWRAQFKRAAPCMAARFSLWLANVPCSSLRNRCRDPVMPASRGDLGIARMPGYSQAVNLEHPRIPTAHHHGVLHVDDRIPHAAIGHAIAQHYRTDFIRWPLL